MIIDTNPVLQAICKEDVNEINKLLAIPATFEEFLSTIRDPNNQDALSTACMRGDHTKKFGVLNALCQKILSLHPQPPIPGLMDVIILDLETWDCAPKQRWADLAVQLAHHGYPPAYGSESLLYKLIDIIEECRYGHGQCIPSEYKIKVMEAFFTRVNNPISPNNKDKNGGKGDLLFYALHKDRIEVAEFLLKSGATITKHAYAGPGSSLTAFEWWFKDRSRYKNGSALEKASWSKVIALCEKYGSGVGIPVAEQKVGAKNGSKDDHTGSNNQVSTEPKDEATVKGMVGYIAVIGTIGGGICGIACEIVGQQMGTSCLSSVLSVSQLSSTTANTKIALAALGGAAVGCLVVGMSAAVLSR